MKKIFLITLIFFIVIPFCVYGIDGSNFDGDNDGDVDAEDLAAFAQFYGTLRFYKDFDGDYYSDGNTQYATSQPVGYFSESDLTAIDGDCDDDNSDINPGAIEICDDNLVDNDCDGLSDCADPDCYNSISCQPCDGELAMDSSDAFDAARAIGLCTGVVDAQWVKPDGTPSPNPLGRGMLPNFGPNILPKEGLKMLALSTGVARDPSDPGYIGNPSGYSAGYTSATPTGHPLAVAVPGCPVPGEAYDGIGLRLELSVPSNSIGFSFNLKMYTSDFPEWVCSTYIDYIAVIMDPSPPGAIAGNIAFDSIGNPISANSDGSLVVCVPQSAGGIFFPCPLGNGDLFGTGFEGHGGTPWLTVHAPIPSGATTITLLFTTWDSGDGTYDTTTLIDNWQWLTDGTTSVETQ